MESPGSFCDTVEEQLLSIIEIRGPNPVHLTFFCILRCTEKIRINKNLAVNDPKKNMDCKKPSNDYST